MAQATKDELNKSAQQTTQPNRAQTPHYAKPLNRKYKPKEQKQPCIQVTPQDSMQSHQNTTNENESKDSIPSPA